jgi:hypothetical protein
MQFVANNRPNPNKWPINLLLGYRLFGLFVLQAYKLSVQLVTAMACMLDRPIGLTQMNVITEVNGHTSAIARLQSDMTQVLLRRLLTIEEWINDCKQRYTSVSYDDSRTDVIPTLGDLQLAGSVATPIVHEFKSIRARLAALELNSGINSNTEERQVLVLCVNLSSQIYTNLLTV